MEFICNVIQMVGGVTKIGETHLDMTPPKVSASISFNVDAHYDRGIHDQHALSGGFLFC